MALENWFSKRTKLSVTAMQLRYLAWSKVPRVHWPLPVTSSVACSCFQKSMPGIGLRGRGLLELPLWHSAIFSRQIPSTVREMREHTYCCARLVNRGLWVLGGCLTATRQVNTILIPQIPRSYRVLYTRHIVDLADRAAASQGDGAILSTPPPRGRVVLCQYPEGKGTGGSDRGEVRIKGMGAPTGVQCAAQALPLCTEGAVAESASGSQDVRFWTSVHSVHAKRITHTY